ncbi:MAG: hypothetical protein IPL93_11580 [Actinomycetales bacterium]|nr:hypothetical protein [Actinomycetales bacterium]
MTAPFRLVVGAPAPRQAGPDDCGPTALTVARMLVDPDFNAWVSADGPAHGFSSGGTTPPSRFTAYVGQVHRRATSVVGPSGALQLPWPRALGTPPWGVCRELELLARPRGARYRAVLVRWMSQPRRERLLQHLAGHLSDGRPGALFVGSPGLPRHVGLIVPGGEVPAIYDPGHGTVTGWEVDALASGRADIGGWPELWWLIAPLGQADSTAAGVGAEPSLAGGTHQREARGPRST